MQRIELLRTRLVRGNTDCVVVLPHSSVARSAADAGGGAERGRVGCGGGVLSSLRLFGGDVEVATRVLIAGGGVAALEAALALRALAEDRVTVEMLATEPQYCKRPLAVADP
jgi:NADPH-dependent 2,4-dienoyl-CoA reductase/sulfur reductase-like enzyme